MTGRDELTKIAYEMQIYREEAQMLQQQLGNLQLNYASVELAIQTLENVAKLNKGEQMLLPIGSGAYIKSKADNNELALVDVGAGVIVEKPIPDAVKFLKSRMGEMDSVKEKLQKNFVEVSNKLKFLEESANNLMQKMQTAPSPKEDKEEHQEYR